MDFWITSSVILAVFVQPTRQRFIVALVYALLFIINLFIVSSIYIDSHALYATAILLTSSMANLLVLVFILAFTKINKMIFRVSIISLASILVNFAGLALYLLSVQSLYYNAVNTTLAGAMFLALCWRNDDDLDTNKDFSINLDFSVHYHSWINYIRAYKVKT